MSIRALSKPIFLFVSNALHTERSTLSLMILTTREKGNCRRLRTVRQGPLCQIAPPPLSSSKCQTRVSLRENLPLSASPPSSCTYPLRPMYASVRGKCVNPSISIYVRTHSVGPRRFSLFPPKDSRKVTSGENPPCFGSKTRRRKKILAFSHPRARVVRVAVSVPHPIQTRPCVVVRCEMDAVEGPLLLR